MTKPKMKPYPGADQVRELVLAGNWAEAKAALERAAENFEGSAAKNDLALVLATMGEQKRALELINQAQTKADADIRVYVNHYYLGKLADFPESRGQDALFRVVELRRSELAVRPRISVIMRTYNRPGLISEAIASVKNQKFQDWELVIVNDGGDRAVEKTLERLWDPRMAYAFAKHSGPAGALNVGLGLASGDWIGFLDDDDIFYPDLFEKLFEWLGSHPGAEVVYGDAKNIWLDPKTGKVFKSEYFAPGAFRQDRLWSSNFISIIFAVFLSRKCLERVPGCLEGLRSSMDWEFYLALSRHFKFDYLHFPAGERRYPEGLARVGKRSILERNLQRNLVLYYHGHSPFYSFGLGKSGTSQRFLNLLDDFLERFENLIQALELRKLFQEPEYAFFYELGGKLEKESRWPEARAAYKCAWRMSLKEIKAWGRWIRSWLR